LLIFIHSIKHSLSIITCKDFIVQFLFIISVWLQDAYQSGWIILTLTVYNASQLLRVVFVECLTNGAIVFTRTTFSSSDIWRIHLEGDVIITTKLIVVLELKHTDQQNFWFMIIENGCKQLLKFDLSKENVDLLINVHFNQQ
jgi:hypothetical protein